jgi:large subunit ribosomal protein L22
MSWDELTVEELGKELESRGLKKSGKKDELVARLEDYEAKLGEAKAAEAEAEEAEEAAEAEEKPAPPEAKPTPLVVRASAKYVRSAPRKARLVMQHIRGQEVEQARATLSHTPRAAAGEILKLLDSAVANAENNFELDADELRVARAYVDEGPTIKRYRARALGRATRIDKRTSHMTIELTTSERA